MMPSARRMYLRILVGAVVALVPPSLAHMQARSEQRDRAARTEAEADAGYKTLVESVRELSATVSAQHDAITKLQGYVDALQALAPGMRMTSRPAPMPAPTFPELPPNLPAAQAAQ